MTRALCASRGGERLLRVGLEAELIPIASESGHRVAPDATPSGAPGLLPVIRRAVERAGGSLDADTPSGPRAHIPNVGMLTFEPGGQLELATAPFSSVDELTRAARSVLEPLARDAEESGITLLARGMDAAHRASDVPLVVASERYRKQRAHYDRIGPWGADMMVLSAGLHVNVDLGGRPVRRWWLANRLAPVLTALFANSPAPAGPDAPARRSNRAEQWRHLDPARTGLFGEDEDAPGTYLTFALEAPDFLGGPEGVPAAPFREAWVAGADLERWRRHLTTLFPEVRPRRYLELRSVDAQRPAWYAVPLVVVTGLLNDPRSLARAEQILPPADEDLLLLAGRQGVRDPELRALALHVLDLGISAARELGAEIVGAESIETAEEFRRRFTAAGLDPGDEPDGLPLFEP